VHAQWHWLLHLTGSGNGTVKNIRYIDEEDIRSFKVSLFMNLRTNRVAKHLSVPVGSVLLALCCWLLHLTSTPIFYELAHKQGCKAFERACWLCAVGSVPLALCCWLCAVSSVLLALCC